MTRKLEQHPNALAIGVLVLIPVLVFGGADVFGGHLLLYGDNLIQSYPLHVLVGDQLRHGTYPAWDPYIWSGDPLAAGLNAGAFYPTTLLFALLPAHLSWVLGEIFIYSAAATGAYLLFRAGGARPLPCVVGAFVFSFAGSFAAQASVHLDMADGLAAMPWVLLAVRRIADDGRWRWSVLLAISFGVAVLAGSPEALLAIFATAVTYSVARISLDRARWRTITTRFAAGLAVAAGSTAFLWVPAVEFIVTSTRYHASATVTSEYAFPPWSFVLLFVPYLEGGYHVFSQVAYFGQSNLGELSLYLGILPLIAVLAVATRSWRDRLPAGERLTWFAVLAVGLVLAIAAGTPAGNLLHHVPLYGTQRDTGRNVAEVDLAMSALFAWWLDGGGDPRPLRRRSEAVASVIPLAIVATLAFWYAVAPHSLWSAADAFVKAPFRPKGTAAALGLALALAAGAATIALLRSRLTRRVWMSAATAFVVADVALFSLGSGYLVAQAPPEPGHPSALVSLVSANLSQNGRYALFDPDLYDPNQLVNTGEPDLGIIDSLPSASGYGALLDSRYGDVTEANVRLFLLPSWLQTQSSRGVGLQVLVTVPESFLVPVRGTPFTRSFTVLKEQPGVDPALPGGNVPLPQLLLLDLPVTRARPALRAGQSSGWWFGTRLGVDSASVALLKPSRGDFIRLGLIANNGRVHWLASRHVAPGARVIVVPAYRVRASGLEVELMRGSSLGPLRVTVAVGRRHYLLAGPLSDSVTPKQWTTVGVADRFVVLRARFKPVAASLQTDDPGATSAHVRIVESSGSSATIDVVTPRRGRLVWSTAYNAGWRATVSGRKGASTATVRRVGLVVGVDVPAGTSVVRFTYAPVDVSLSFGISLATLTLTALASLVSIARLRRRTSRDN